MNQRESLRGKIKNTLIQMEMKIYQNVSDAAKALLRGNFIVLKLY